MADNTSSGKQAEAILHAQDYLKILKARWKEAFFVFLLIFFCTALITKLMERRYTSVARIEIKTPREMVDVTGSAGRSSLQAEATKEYIVTQFEILVSDNNLKQVAKNLGMPAGEKEDGSAAGMLRPKIKIEPVAGTNMVDIVVTDTDPNQACSICEQVVQVYRDARNGEEEALRNQAVIDLEKAHKDAAAKLAAAEQALTLIINNDKFRSKGYISASNPWAENSAADEAAGGLRQRYTELKSEVVALEKALSKIEWYKDYLLGKGRKNEETVSSEQGAEASGETQVYDDEKLLTYIANTKLEHTESKATEEIASLFKARNDLKLALKQALTEGYGKKHLKVQELQNQIDANQTALDERLTAWKASLDPDIDLKNRELAIAKAKIAEVEKQLREYDDITKQIAKAKEDYKNAKAEEQETKKLYNDEKRRQKVTRASIVEHSKPYVAKAPSTPNVQLNLIIGAAVGLVSGLVVAFVYNFFDTSVKSLEDAERHLGLPVLGVIPQDVPLLALEDDSNPDAEAYRILRTNIQLKRDLYNAKTFAVVSANAGEGKTTTLSNLAYVYAKAGYSTLMIDGDMRRPRLARYANMDCNTGLSNYLTGDLELKEVVYKTQVPNLYILPSGVQPIDPAGLLGSPRMNQLISETTKRFDIVFFDSPPVLGVSDASVLVSKVDVTLLVLQPRKMPLKALLRTKSIIENVGGRLMGLVMNNVDISADTQYQYYTTYYSYYSTETPKMDSSVATAEHADVMEASTAEEKKDTDKVALASAHNDKRHSDKELY